MGTGVLLVAIGAILRYAVNDSIDSVDLQTVGLILMIAGVVTFVVGAIYAASVRRRGVVVAEQPVAPVARDPRDPRY
jgi:vacuolar-type H+-ATPase subunit I/STV1